jgi:L-alanine-DL-glutamate epimerase-like enolase superfamily enzyme
MRISAIHVYSLDLPLSGAGYTFAKGKKLTTVDTTLVRVDTDEGLSGWGETCPLGRTYLPSYPEGIRTGIGVLSASLIGRDPRRIGAVNETMDKTLEGHAYVKSAIDVACHDIFGKASGLPVHALLGGRHQESLPMYFSLTQDDPDDMLALARQRWGEGYGHVQVKVGGDVARDIERIRAVVGGKGDDNIVICDANRGWRRDEAVRVAAATRDLDYVLEQPCDRYDDCLTVRRRAPQPFKLDETLKGAQDILRALNDDAMDVACIKVSKLGGLSKSRFARDLCAAAGIPMCVEDVWGGDIVAAALAHLAVSTPSDVFLNTTDLHNYNDLHFAAGAPVAERGRLIVGDEPGLGVTPDENVLGEPVASYQ